MSRLSVVIPTYNRCGTLQKALVAHQGQTAAQDVAEILVIDDGSTDSTASVVAQLTLNSRIPIRYFRQQNKGPAAARNVGIRESKSEIILFTDDDIIPTPTLVAEHLDWHKRFPELSTAVLGYVTWDPEVNPTPFMKWYGSKALFSYARLKSQTEVEYLYFYTCNLSVRTDFLRNNGTFDEEFKVAAWEDIELGYRLHKAGMRLFYNSDALAYHHQNILFADACRRARKAAPAREVFCQKEAGLHYHGSLETGNASPLGQRHKKQALKLVTLALVPLKSVMDWPVQLPESVYRMMFRVYHR